MFQGLDGFEIWKVRRVSSAVFKKQKGAQVIGTVNNKPSRGLKSGEGLLMT
jgi:hypothetical protein